MSRRLYRSHDDSVLAGVAGGMAETYDLDPALVRVGWVILGLLTGGVILVVYIVMALVIPLVPDDQPAAWQSGQWSPREGPSIEGADAMTGSGGAMSGPPADETTFGQAPPPGGPTYVSEREARRQERASGQQRGSDMGGALVIGLLLIGVGGYFLLRDYLPAIAWGQLWPIALIVVGAMLLLGSFRRGSR